MAFESQRARTYIRERGGRVADRRPVDAHTRPDPALETIEPATPPARDWRNDVIGLSGLNVIAGIWLIIAPWVLGYSKDPYWNDIVFGAIVGLLALIRISGAYRDTWLSWINALIGIWLFISAWVVDSTSTAATNDIILGVIVFVLAVASASATPLSRARPPAA
jgi:hypothetical protein